MILASAYPLILVLSVLAATAYAWPAVRARHMGPQTARVWVLLAWLLHGAALGWSVFGDQPHFGFAPALSVTAWLVAAVYAVESQIYPQLQTRWALCSFGAVAVIVAFAFPGHSLRPSASPWLPVHLALGIASYGLFGIAVVHAWFMTRTEERIRHAQDPHSGIPLLTLERLTFRFVEAGFVVLSATLLIGVFSGDTANGAAFHWRWDHKSVFSLMSWLTIAVLLVGRARFGWRGKHAVRVLYTGATFLLLAYVGSRFVLEVLLGRVA